MVVSFVPGRIRLRFRELKDGDTAALAKARIRENPGITGVEVNPLTGSILIDYDPALLSTEKLVETGKRELVKLNIKPDLWGLP